MHTPAVYMYVTVNTSVWICVSVDACPFSLCVNMCLFICASFLLGYFEDWVLGSYVRNVVCR